MLPFAVPEIDPAAVYAIFVNEINGAIVGTQKLCRLPSTATCTAVGSAPDSNFSYWSTVTGQNLVDIPTENTGVVILYQQERNHRRDARLSARSSTGARKSVQLVARPHSLPRQYVADWCQLHPRLV